MSHILHKPRILGFTGRCNNTLWLQVPAYAAGATCVYDFKPVLSQEKIKELSTEDLQRWA